MTPSLPRLDGVFRTARFPPTQRVVRIFAEHGTELPDALCHGSFGFLGVFPETHTAIAMPDKEVAIDVHADDRDALAAPPPGNQRRAPAQDSDNVDFSAVDLDDGSNTNSGSRLLECGIY